jgi:ABC-type ATPase with predicted acetyltransferase domain
LYTLTLPKPSRAGRYSCPRDGGNARCSATGTGPTTKPTIILADEFAASLDLPTAYLLCRQIRRLITPATPLAIVLATPRLELLAPLAPDKIIVKPLQAQATIIVPRKKRP